MNQTTWLPNKMKQMDSHGGDRRLVILVSLIVLVPLHVAECGGKQCSTGSSVKNDQVHACVIDEHQSQFVNICAVKADGENSSRKVCKEDPYLAASDGGEVVSSQECETLTSLQQKEKVKYSEYISTSQEYQDGPLLEVQDSKEDAHFSASNDLLHRSMLGLEDMLGQVEKSSGNVFEKLGDVIDQVGLSRERMMKSLDTVMDRVSDSVSESKVRVIKSIDSLMDQVSASKTRMMKKLDHVIDKVAHSKVIEEIRALPEEIRDSVVLNVRNRSYLAAGVMVAITTTILVAGAVYFAWCHHDAWSYHWVSAEGLTPHGGHVNIPTGVNYGAILNNGSNYGVTRLLDEHPDDNVCVYNDGDQGDKHFGPGHGVIEGNTGHGVIEGNTGHGVIEGNTGHGVIEGNTGHGVIEGNTGHGVIEGNTGHGVIEGNTGHGVIEGNTGHGVIERNTGHGVIEGNTGHGVIEGNTGHGVIEGNTGHGLIEGNTGHGVIEGNTGHGVIEGDTGHGVIEGNTGHGVIEGNTGHGVIEGNTGHGVIEGDTGHGVIEGNTEDTERLGDVGLQKLSLIHPGVIQSSSTSFMPQAEDIQKAQLKEISEDIIPQKCEQETISNTHEYQDEPCDPGLSKDSGNILAPKDLLCRCECMSDMTVSSLAAEISSHKSAVSDLIVDSTWHEELAVHVHQSCQEHGGKSSTQVVRPISTDTYSTGVDLGNAQHTCLLSSLDSFIPMADGCFGAVGEESIQI